MRFAALLAVACIAIVIAARGCADRRNEKTPNPSPPGDTQPAGPYPSPEEPRDASSDDQASRIEVAPLWTEGPAAGDCVYDPASVPTGPPSKFLARIRARSNPHARESRRPGFRDRLRHRRPPR
jgi:hypothetical protein